MEHIKSTRRLFQSLALKQGGLINTRALSIYSMHPYESFPFYGYLNATAKKSTEQTYLTSTLSNLFPIVQQKNLRFSMPLRPQFSSTSRSCSCRS